MVLLFPKKNHNKRWKLEYFDTIYKIYDWNKNLAGYFCPNYDMMNESEVNEKEYVKNYDFDEETTVIDKMNRENQKVFGGNLMLPMIKLYLLDNEEGINLDYAISSLEDSTQRVKKWKDWIQTNQVEFNLMNSAMYTSREDRNMLSIVLGIGVHMVLGEKELMSILNPLLNKLHENGMI
jgi:hypothetical protein